MGSIVVDVQAVVARLLDRTFPRLFGWLARKIGMPARPPVGFGLRPPAHMSTPGLLASRTFARRWLAARSGRQDHARATESLQRRRGIVGTAIDVLVRPELPRER